MNECFLKKERTIYLQDMEILDDKCDKDADGKRWAKSRKRPVQRFLAAQYIARFMGSK